jgi:hypothetical protein
MRLRGEKGERPTRRDVAERRDPRRGSRLGHR